MRCGFLVCWERLFFSKKCLFSIPNPKPLPRGKGLNVGLPPSPRLGLRPKARMLWLLAKSFARCKTSRASNAKHPFLITIEVFLQPAAYSSVFDIYLIQRPCLFSVPATFTQDIISYAGDVRWKPVYRDGYPYSHNSESGHGRQDIRKKHSCCE